VPFQSLSSPGVPLLQLVDNGDVDDHGPALAWQENTATYDLDLACPCDAPLEEQLVASEGHQWVVIYVCGAGLLSVGSKLLHQPSDIWTCFGNVMLAKRGQQIMLCRCAAYPQMINIQCASNGRDVVIHDSRCSSEDWYMHISHEQVCMDSLAWLLLFMLTAASQVLAQFGFAKCSPSATSSSLPPWQTSCSQTNQWVSQSGARMWDVVFNGKEISESHCEDCSYLTDDANSSYSCKGSDSANLTLSALCGGDMSSEPRCTLEASRMGGPVQLALDKEPDRESVVIQDIDLSSVARNMPLILHDHQMQLAPEIAISDARTEIQKQVLMEHTEAEEARVSLHAQLSDPELPSTPRKLTSKRTSSRPRPQRGSKVHAHQSSFESFRMDAGEKSCTRKRESSLARHYDALDADVWKQCDDPRARQSNTLDDLDGFKAPADLPPVKGKTSKQTASRFYARHRAAMEAASVMAWEPEHFDMNQVHTCTTPSAVERSNDSESWSFNSKRVGASPASAMSLDLDAGMPKNSSAVPEFTATCCLRPFAISTAKLPSLLPQKSSKVAAWRVPTASPFYAS